MYWDESLIGNDFGLPRKNRYVLFDKDIGGLNNIRLVLEYVAVIAAITRRTLVLPPARPWYLLSKSAGGEAEGVLNMSDMFEIEALKNAIPVLTTNEFINQASEHLGIPEKFQGTDFAVEQPEEILGEWESWLSNNSESPDWKPHITLLCYPSIEAAKRGPHLTETYVDSRQLVEFSPRMLASPVLYFPSNSERRSLGPVDQMLACPDNDLPRLGRRLIKHHVRYRNEIYDLARKAVDNLGLDRFYAIHVRRNDFQYTQTRLQASEIARNVGSLFDEKLPLYLATDDPGNELRDDLQDLLGVPKIVRLNDALDALQADVPFEWLGTLEKAICALATRFVGTDLSTFSGYIHRLRGYLNSGDPGCYYHSIKYANPDDGAHHPDVKKGQEYLRENPLMWQDC